MINRRTAKRQIAAARALLQVVRMHEIEIPNARACDQWIAAINRLRTSTETLARETYQAQEQRT